MLIAHLRFAVAPEYRQKALDALTIDAPKVRAMNGCVAFVPFFDLTDDTALGVMHEWESDTDFAAYTASEPFKRFGATIRPMMIGTPVSKRFRAELKEVAD